MAKSSRMMSSRTQVCESSASFLGSRTVSACLSKCLTMKSVSSYSLGCLFLDFICFSKVVFEWSFNIAPAGSHQGLKTSVQLAKSRHPDRLVACLRVSICPLFNTCSCHSLLLSIEAIHQMTLSSDVCLINRECKSSTICAFDRF